MNSTKPSASELQLQSLEDIYPRLRASLLMFFEVRRCNNAADLAAEVVLRVLGNIHRGVQIDSITSFAHGVAINVYREHCRKPENFMVCLPENLPAPIGPMVDYEAADHYLPQCLALLTSSERNLLLKYYENEARQKIESRKLLAGQLKISSVALRVRVFQVRKKLAGYLNAYLSANSD